MIIRLKKINLIIFILFFFLGSLEANQIFDIKKSVKDNDFSNFISEFGDPEKDSKFSNIFFEKSFEDIQSFIKALPNRSPNPVIQKIIYDLLTAKKRLNRNFISKGQDEKIFELLVSQLFETGRISEIELYYSQSTNLNNNEYILKKMIEGNLLRNRHNEACKILDTTANQSPEVFGKIIIICDILNNRYEEAKLGLLLLKEQNNPGDTFFIDLAYSLMSEDDLNDSENLKKNLEQIKSLNPIIMSSLQYADISPNYEQVENLNTSGLLFILSNPAVEIDIKIFCAELLVKQGRIGFDFLSEAYLLPRFGSEDLENSLKIYKTLSPAKARPLLYQAIVAEKNDEIRLQKIIALLKTSIIDDLFSPISNLIANLIKLDEDLATTENLLLISKVFQSQKDFFNANSVLDRIKNQSYESLIFRKISVELAKYLNNKLVNDPSLEENISKLTKLERISSEKHKKIIMNLILNYNLNQNMMNQLKKIAFQNSEKLSDYSVQKLFLAQNFSEKNDLFNSLSIFFDIVGNNNIKNLDLLQTYQILLILKNLGFDDELKELSKSIIE